MAAMLCTPRSFIRLHRTLTKHQSQGESTEELFLDRDPDAFRVLMSCMRCGRIMLPADNLNLAQRALIDAEFAEEDLAKGLGPGA